MREIKAYPMSGKAVSLTRGGDRHMTVTSRMTGGYKAEREGNFASGLTIHKAVAGKGC